MTKFKALWKTITGQNWGPASLGVILVTAVVVIAGAIVVITDPSTLSFKQYETDLLGVGGFNGLLAVGRGIHLSALASQLGVTAPLAQIEAAATALAPLAGTKVAAAVNTVVADTRELTDPAPPVLPEPVVDPPLPVADPAPVVVADVPPVASDPPAAG